VMFDGIGIGIDVRFLLYQLPRDSRHVNRLPCKNIPVFLEEFDKHKFLIGVQTIPKLHDLRRVTWA
jgi:hypothetical protein